MKHFFDNVSVALVAASLLLTQSESLRAQGCCGGGPDPSGNPGFSFAFEAVGRVSQNVRVTLTDLSSSQVIRDVNVLRPVDASNPTPVIFSLPVRMMPEAGIKVEYSGGASGGSDSFGMRAPGSLLLIRRSTESEYRAGDYLPQDGSIWYFKLRYPYAGHDPVTGAVEEALPSFEEPYFEQVSGSDYDATTINANKPRVSWIARLGDGGGFILLGGDLYSGGATNPSNIKFYPGALSDAAYPTTPPYSQMLSRKESGTTKLLADRVNVTNGYKVTVYDATSSGYSGSLPMPLTNCYLENSFQLETITPASGYDHALKLTRGNASGPAFESAFHLKWSSSGYQMRTEHNGLRRIEVTMSFDRSAAPYKRLVTRTVTDISGTPVVVSQTEETYQIVAGLEQLVYRKDTTNHNGDFETAYTYETTSTSVNYGKPLKWVKKLGSDEVDYTGSTYDFTSSTQFITHQYRPFESNPSSSTASSFSPSTWPGVLESVTSNYPSTDSNGIRQPARETLTEKKINTQTVAKTTSAYSIDGGGNDALTQNQYTDASNYLTTTTKTYPRQSAAWYRATQVLSSQGPDGVTETFDYQYSTSTKELTTQNWKLPSGASTPVNGRTARETSVTNRWGKPVSLKREAYVSGAYQLLWIKEYYQDALHGRPWTIYHFGAGDSASRKIAETSYWIGSRTEKDLHGVSTYEAWDRLGRLKERTAEGASAQLGHAAIPDLVTTYSYSGLTTTETTTGSSLSMQTSKTTDRIGRVLSVTDAQGLTSTYDHTFTATGTKATVATMTDPKGFTEITESYMDGQRKAAHGTKRVAQCFDYDVSSGLTTSVTYPGISSGTGSRYSKQYSDWAGRTVKSERPGTGSSTIREESDYYATGTAGAGGRLKTVRHTGTSMLGAVIQEYDTHGEPYRSATDANGNLSIDVSGSDRLQEMTKSIEYVGADLYEITRLWLYDASGGTHKKKLSETGQRLNQSPYEELRYHVAYTDNDGAHGTKTETVHRVMDRSLKTWQEESTTKGLDNVSLGYTAFRKYLNGLLEVR